MADPVPLTGIPESIPEAVAAAVRRSGRRVALQTKETGEYRRYTYEEIGRLVGTLSCSLSTLGFRPGQRAAILLENRPEWVIAYLGILYPGEVMKSAKARAAATFVSGHFAGLTVIT